MFQNFQLLKKCLFILQMYDGDEIAMVLKFHWVYFKG